MDYSKRIGDNYLKAEWKDGEIVQHTDLNRLETIIKAGINANYVDIQKILDGTYTVGSASGISGATLSKYADEQLQSSDSKIPSSLQVKSYIDTTKQEVLASIPTKVSQLTNDLGYIDKTVNNLENYYTKTQVYTKEEVQGYVKAIDDLDNYYKKTDTYNKTEVNTLINNITKVTIRKVEVLPSVGEPNIIYFVPKTTTEVDNIYDEYVWIDNAWENIGDTELDNLELDVVKTGHTATLTITKRNGTQESVEIYDGVTPNVQVGTVQTLPEGSSATVTRTGTDAQPVFNFGIPVGATGARGPIGPDGYSPSASVSKSGNTVTISITDKEGTTTESFDAGGLSESQVRTLINNAGAIEINQNTVTMLREYYNLGENDLLMIGHLIKYYGGGIYKFKNVSGMIFNSSLNALNGDEGMAIILPGANWYVYFRLNTTGGAYHTKCTVFSASSSNITETTTFTAAFNDMDFGIVSSIKTNVVNNFYRLFRETLLSTSSYVNIDGEYTFRTMPQVSNANTVVPTYDTHLTTKKYVDGLVGNINTVLATLTTPSNGGE